MSYQLTAINPFVIADSAETAGEIIDRAADLVRERPHIPRPSLTVWTVDDSGRTINEPLSQMAREGITSAEIRSAMSKILPELHSVAVSRLDGLGFYPGWRPDGTTDDYDEIAS